MTSLPPSTNPPCPPAEIWKLILRFATESETSYLADYLPFQPIQELQETAASRHQESLRLQTCLSLVHVSRHFHAIAAEFLYKDVRIYDAPGLESLLAGLRRSAKEDGVDGYGSCIRRLELPRRRNKFFPDSQNLPFPTHPVPCAPDVPRLCELLRLCPRLEILVRPCLRLDAENISFWASLVGTPVVGRLPCLLRLEWHESELDSRFYGPNNSERLREIVAQAPNLRYLFLSSDRQNSLVDLALPSSLHTIRINRSHFQSPRMKKYMVRARYPKYVPNFKNLILHATLPTALLDFVAVAGQQLRTLELAFAPQMIYSSSQLQRLLSRCSQLEELVYFLGAPEISPLVAFQAPSVKRVRLKVDPEEWSPCKPVLRGQMEILEGPSFPQLEELIIHDPTRWFQRRELGQDLLRRMVRRGCTVRYEDGSPVMLSV
ncbi:hypothetical protein C8F04DRAFT_333558 [Mycena alexandri]|uniref:Uncharacterized protein n=1 Tax=Mycena alexandri TaxID=1745969 RepID=A0AAD6S3Y2_9AGAR|nr:hypothetical protein C8F04DRAFT_333558 [Mycena alexandri]